MLNERKKCKMKKCRMKTYCVTKCWRKKWWTKNMQKYPCFYSSLPRVMLSSDFLLWSLFRLLSLHRIIFSIGVENEGISIDSSPLSLRLCRVGLSGVWSVCWTWFLSLALSSVAALGTVEDAPSGGTSGNDETALEARTGNAFFCSTRM